VNLFPNILLKLVRAPNLNSNQLAFRVPKSMNKFEIKKFLFLSFLFSSPPLCLSSSLPLLLSSPLLSSSNLQIFKSSSLHLLTHSLCFSTSSTSSSSSTSSTSSTQKTFLYVYLPYFLSPTSSFSILIPPSLFSQFPLKRVRLAHH